MTKEIFSMHVIHVKGSTAVNLISDFITCHLRFIFTINNIFFCGISFCRASSATLTSYSNILLMVSDFSVDQHHLIPCKKQTLGTHTLRDSDSICVMQDPQSAFLTRSHMLGLLFHSELEGVSLEADYVFKDIECLLCEDSRGSLNKFNLHNRACV